MAHHIRPLASEDRGGVVALSLRAWEPVFASLRHVLRGSGVFEAQHPDWWVSQRAAVEQVCDDPDTPVWVAEVDAGVAGFVAARLHLADRMGEIVMLAVDPPFQRRGVGSALTGAAASWVTERGMTTLMAETGGDPGHDPARACYERAGFTPLPVVRYFRTV